MSPKIKLDAKSKLSTSDEEIVNDKPLGLISNKNTAIVRSFRLRNSDIEKLNNMRRDLSNLNTDVIYKQTDIIRAAIFLLSQQDSEIILENIRKCR